MAGIIKADKLFRWKNRNVSEKVYNKKLKQSFNLKAKLKNQTTEKKKIDGQRIVDVSHLAEQLQCECCKNVLSLKNIVNEEREGFASTFDIQCEFCLLTRKVTTSRQISLTDKNLKFYDVNCRAVMVKYICYT